MNVLLYVISFSFSFFFILISYWKEDKNLNIIGSLSLVILFIVLIGTSVQSTGLVLANVTTTETVAGNVTTIVTTNVYESQIYQEGVFMVSLGIGLMLSIFTIIQYLWFSLVYIVDKRAREGDKR